MSSEKQQRQRQRSKKSISTYLSQFVRNFNGSCVLMAPDEDLERIGTFCLIAAETAETAVESGQIFLGYEPWAVQPASVVVLGDLLKSACEKQNDRKTVGRRFLENIISSPLFSLAVKETV